jgi:hypothetical protein
MRQLRRTARGVQRQERESRRGFFRPAAVQTKLAIDGPGDAHGREADAVADRVMREEVSPDELRQARGGGQPLPESTRSWMAHRFGAEFGRVRVHTGAGAVQLSRELNARAFTRGDDIYFNDGEFAPGTREGKQLLAHELTHVVQQRTGRKRIQKQAFTSPVDFRERLFSRWFTVPSGHSLEAVIDAHRSPEGCSLPSSYTVYLYNTGEKRYETSVTYSVDSRRSYTWKGLPGGTYQFIFLMRGAAEGCRLVGTIETRHIRAADNILPTIRGYVGDTRWAYSASTPPGANTNKCNQFVYEVLNEAGAAVLRMERTRFGFQRPSHPPLAKQWADSGVSIAGWEVVSQPQPGDVAAEAIEYSDASGHVGIVSSVAADGSGTTISATSDRVVENDWGFRAGQSVTFRRYRGR